MNVDVTVKPRVYKQTSHVVKLGTIILFKLWKGGKLIATLK